MLAVLLSDDRSAVRRRAAVIFSFAGLAVLGAGLGMALLGAGFEDDLARRVLIASPHPFTNFTG